MLPTPIFERGDVYEASLWFVALCLMGLLFPTGAFSNGLKTVSRWRFFGIVAAFAFVTGLAKLTGGALRQGAQAAGGNYAFAWGVLGGLTPILMAVVCLRLWLSRPAGRKTGEF
jgi:hypothetical protein